DQAPAETGKAGIFGVDGRKRSGHEQASLILQRLQARQMRGPRRAALVQTTWRVVSDDGVPHATGFHGGARMVADDPAGRASRPGGGDTHATASRSGVHRLRRSREFCRSGWTSTLLRAYACTEPVISPPSCLHGRRIPAIPDIALLVSAQIA